MAISAMMLGCLVMGCSETSHKVSQEKAEDDRLALQQLQGVWIDDNTGMPMLKVKGDTMYLASQANLPIGITVTGDSLIPHASDRMAYRIKSLQSDVFQFYLAQGDLVSLHKASDDSIPFGYDTGDAMVMRRTVEKKDSVINFQGRRYRGYVYINPSTRKVVCPQMSEEGIMVDNVYYDNVIHICVYQGRKRLYSKDIVKDMFAGIIPGQFLKLSVLSDMDFVGVSDKGYQYRATVCVPNGMSCYYVDLTADTEGHLFMELRQ